MKVYAGKYRMYLNLEQNKVRLIAPEGYHQDFDTLVEAEECLNYKTQLQEEAFHYTICIPSQRYHSHASCLVAEALE